MGNKVVKTGAIYINNSRTPGGVSYIYADNNDSDKFQIGRGTSLGESVALSINTDGQVHIPNASLTGSMSGTIDGIIDGQIIGELTNPDFWLKNDDAAPQYIPSIYHPHGNVGIGQANPISALHIGSGSLGVDFPYQTSVQVTNIVDGGNSGYWCGRDVNQWGSMIYANPGTAGGGGYGLAFNTISPGAYPNLYTMFMQSGSVGISNGGNNMTGSVGTKTLNSLTLQGDNAIFRIGANKDQSDYSSRIEMVESCGSGAPNGAPMKYGAAFVYDGKADETPWGWGAWYLEMYDNNTTGTKVIGVGRDVTANTLVVQGNDAGGPVVGINTGTPDGASYALDVNGAAHASSFPTCSDTRFKKNRVDVVSGSIFDKLDTLSVQEFEWNDTINSKRGGYKKNEKIVGLMAQEVELVFPELITQWKLDDTYADARAIDYGKMVPILVGAVKELQRRLKLTEGELFDTTAPVITLSGKPDAVSAEKNPSFTFSANEAATFEVFLTGWKSWQAASSPKTFSNLTSGTRTFSVRATDLKGNVSAATTYTWEIDLTSNVLGSFGYPDWTGTIQNPTTSSAFSSPAHTLSGSFAYNSWTGTIQNPATSSNFGTVAHSVNNLFGEKHWSGTISNPTLTSNFSNPSHSIGANFNANGKLGW